jgi:hypothetical protein
MRVPTVLLVLAALVFAGIAGAATLDRLRVEPTAVTALDMTDQAVATATAWSPGHCESVDLWSPDIRGAYRFSAPGPCPRTSTGRGIASVSTSYNDVAWLAYAGGNTRDWTLWTASRDKKRPVRLRFASAPVEDPAPIVLGNGADGKIPYAVGRNVVVLDHSSYRPQVLTWRAPARVVALAGVDTSIGVLLETGHFELVGWIGRKAVVSDYAYAPGEVTAFRTGAPGLIVSTKTDIEINDGTTRTPLGIGPGARLVGFADGNVVYTRGAEIRDFYRATGEDVLLRHVKPPFLAEFDRRGLAWTTGRHVCFAVRAYFASRNFLAPGC